MAKYTLLTSPDGSPLTDPLTGAQLASFTVTVGERKIEARKRIFTTVEQIGSLSESDTLDMVNYAEDLWVRGRITSLHTPKGQKQALRAVARLHWAKADIQGFTQMIVAAGGADAAINASLDAYATTNGLMVETPAPAPPQA